MAITEAQLATNIKQIEGARRRYTRPSPPRGPVFRGGQISWEPSADAAWNSGPTHYRVYLDTENQLVAEVPISQTSITPPRAAQRAFISSYSSVSQLESVHVLLQTPVGIASSNLLPGGTSIASLTTQNLSNLCENPGFESGPGVGWVASGTVFQPLASVLSSNSSGWSIVSTGGRSAPGSALKSGNSNSSDYLFNVIRLGCTLGDELYLSAYVSAASSNGTMLAAILFFDASGNYISGSTVSIAGGSYGYTKVSTIATAPGLSAMACVALYTTGHTSGTYHIDDVRCQALMVVDNQGTTTTIGTIIDGSYTCGVQVKSDTGSAAAEVGIDLSNHPAFLIEDRGSGSLQGEALITTSFNGGDAQLYLQDKSGNPTCQIDSQTFALQRQLFSTAGSSAGYVEITIYNGTTPTTYKIQVFHL